MKLAISAQSNNVRRTVASVLLYDRRERVRRREEQKVSTDLRSEGVDCVKGAGASDTLPRLSVAVGCLASLGAHCCVQLTFED